MRTIRVSHPILDGNHVRAVANKAFSPEAIAAFHGPGTRVGPWVNATRIIHMHMDSGMVPSVIRSLLGVSGDTIPARVEQTMLENGPSAVSILNSVQLDMPGHSLVTSEPSFRIHYENENDQTMCTGKVTVTAHLPAPLHAVAERFMVSRAKDDVERYVDFVKTISSTTRPG
jgi:hypothetical protein